MGPDSINTSVAICGTVASLSRFGKSVWTPPHEEASECYRAADDPEIYEYGFSVMEFPCFDVVLCAQAPYNVQRLPH